MLEINGARRAMLATFKQTIMEGASRDLAPYDGLAG